MVAALNNFKILQNVCIAVFYNNISVASWRKCMYAMKNVCLRKGWMCSTLEWKGMLAGMLQSVCLSSTRQDSDPMSGANSMHEPIFVYTAKLSIKYNEMGWSWDCFICYGLPKVTTEVLNVFRWDGIPAALMLEDQRWGRRQRCFGCCLLCLVVTTLMFWGDSDCCSHVEPCHYCPFCRCFCDYFLSSAAIQQQVLCISLKAVWQKMERCIIIFYLLKI